MSQSTTSGARLTGWIAIVGALVAILCIVLTFMATSDIGAQLNGPTMLALASDSRDVFRWSLLCDILGFYLPLLVIGGYFWNAFREKAGALGDMAALAIVLYVSLGVAGAAMQQAALQPLAQLHSAGDDTVQAATEAVWTGLAHACQKGLWWAEGPVLLFWAWVVGDQIKQTHRWRGLMLQVIGVFYGLFFLFGFFPDQRDITELFETGAVLLTPIWMLWSGWALLRRPVSPTNPS